MENVIHKDRIEKFLKMGGDIVHLISKKEQSELRRLVFANRTNWTKISSLPETVFKTFDRMMREECFVTEMKIPNPPESGPYLVFEERSGKMNILIDTRKSAKGVVHYRKCMAVVVYFAGIKGEIIKTETDENGKIIFSEEDLILLSIATRYCLMPPKLVKKIYLLTKMYAEDGSLDRDKPFLQSFVENIMFQTNVPEWAVYMRLRELAFSEPDVAEFISVRTMDEMIEEYREKGGYKSEAV
ncbi:MAG: hypothetical protein K5851_08135 [Lachnospiraceae bacterium]|nr:hypothetical protein [Lachnospiraceae bacterium]